jgi:hypothetical protein
VDETDLVLFLWTPAKVHAITVVNQREDAPSARNAQAATVRSMDCRSASAADHVCDCGAGVQYPNERKPIFFMQDQRIPPPKATA